MSFEIGQIVVRKKHFAASPADIRTHGRQTIRNRVARPGTCGDHADLILMLNAKQQPAGLIHRPVEERPPAPRKREGRLPAFQPDLA